MRDIGYFERELLRVKRENQDNAKVVQLLKDQIKELQEHISYLKQLLEQQVNND